MDAPSQRVVVRLTLSGQGQAAPAPGQRALSLEAMGRPAPVAAEAFLPRKRTSMPVEPDELDDPESEERLAKRHQTRSAASRRALTADTVLVHRDETALEGGSDSGDEEEVQAEPMYRPPGGMPSIEIPVIRVLDEDDGGCPDDLLRKEQEQDEEDVSDAHFAKMHLIYEIKEQALRENLSGSRIRRFPLRKGGPVSSTELLFAPSVEAKLTKEDQVEVLGKAMDVQLPEERRAEIEGKLHEVEQSYEQGPTHYTRYYLHTQWKPVVTIERPAPVADAAAVEQPKPRLLLKLKRLSDKM